MSQPADLSTLKVMVIDDSSTIRRSAESGSPWLPVERMTTFSGGRSPAS